MEKLLKVLAHPLITLCTLGLILVACSAATFMKLENAMVGVYHSGWFLALLWVLAVNTAACVVREMRRRTVPLGFLFIHLGTLILMAGGVWGAASAVKGQVAIPEGGSVSHFYRVWKGADRLVRGDGSEIEGEFLGLQDGRLHLNPRDGKPTAVPWQDVASFTLDPERPGRKYEKDMLHDMEGGRIEGFLREITSEGLKFEIDGKIAEYPREKVMFMRMGSPDVVHLGFSLRLKRFRIEYYQDSAKTVVLARSPEGETVQLPAKEGTEADLGGGYRIRIVKYAPDAVVDMETRTMETRSKDPKNPGVEVEVTWPEGTERRFAFSLIPMGHGSSGKSGVVVKLMTSEGMPKDYISDLEVLEEGSPVMSREVEVNSPLSYGGYSFYQQSYDMESRPVRSVFQVVKDPGLPLTYAGFALLLAGCFHVCYLRPFMAWRRRSSAAPAATPGSGGSTNAS